MSLAIRYPIDDLQSKLDLLPDLDKVMPDEKKQEVKPDATFIYATKFCYVEHEGSDRSVVLDYSLDEDAMMHGKTDKYDHLVNPLIMFRVPKEAHDSGDFSDLPHISLSKFYRQHKKGAKLSISIKPDLSAGRINQ